MYHDGIITVDPREILLDVLTSVSDIECHHTKETTMLYFSKPANFLKSYTVIRSLRQ